MNVIVMDSEAYLKLKLELKGFVKEALNEVIASKLLERESDWIPISEAKKLLPLKSKTSWQKLRDTGAIQFSQFGRIIMYSRISIIKYIEKNKI